MNSADRLNQMSGLSVTGGRVNANNALALATGTTPTPPDPDSGNPPPDGDPDSDEPGDDEPELTQAIEIDEAFVVNNKKVVVSGYVYTVEDDFEVEGETVDMTCIGRKRNSSSIQAVSRPTDEDGYFRMQLNKRSAAQLKGGTCYLRTASTSEDTVARLRSRK